MAPVTDNAPSSVWRIRSRELQITSRPLLMGILNITPDSFSDGNRFFDIDRAVDRALEMEAEGADIIDIGGESTRPNAQPVPVGEELHRVVPVVGRLSEVLKVPLSIDTYKAAVARESLEAGAEIINDISGFLFDPLIARVVAATGAGAVLMHTRGMPQDMQQNTSYLDIVADVSAALRERMDAAIAAGVSPESIVLDPGLGFAKSREGNLAILRRLEEFTSLGRPLLVGPSRKSFTGVVGGRSLQTRLFSTAAVVALAVGKGAAIIRIHDVREMRDVADMAGEIAAACWN